MRPGAIILCGGKSSRMGRPKAWLPFGCERMLQRVVRRISSVASPIVVVAAPDQELPELPPDVIVARDPVEYQGPLHGLSVGLSAMPEDVELVYASGTDVPFLEPAWISRLVETIGDSDLAIPRADGFHHPLAALYRRKTVLPAIQALLAEGQQRPVALLSRVQSQVLDADHFLDVDPGLRTLQNLNTLDDYHHALLHVETDSLE